MSAMLLQSMLPALKNQHNPHVATPTSNILTAAVTPPRNVQQPPSQHHHHQSSSFLQSLLNGETTSTPPTKPLPPLAVTPPSTATTNLIMNNEDGNKLEYAVTKLTKKHLGLNNARESYQCQVCSKWFAVPPVKHLRGHLVTFKDELRNYIGLINNSGYACLACFQLGTFSNKISKITLFGHLMFFT